MSHESDKMPDVERPASAVATRVLVCGSRDWNDPLVIARQLERLPKAATVIHGDCRGADKTAARLAAGLGLNVEAFPANWGAHGKAAGPIRNRRMLDTKPDLVLAFHDDLGASKGTRDCVEEAQRRGVTVRVVHSARADFRQRAVAPGVSPATPEPR